MIVQCQPYEASTATTFIRDLIQTKRNFLQNHRYAPLETYGEEFADELKDVPDPTIEPIQYLDQFLSILDDFGLWCADRVAFTLICQLEKSKATVRHDRHFILCCLVSSAFVQARAYCEHIFKPCFNDVGERQCIERYSTQKALRLLDILREFKPEKLTTGTPAASPTKVRNGEFTKKVDQISPILGSTERTEPEPTQNSGEPTQVEPKPSGVVNGPRRGRGNFVRRPYNPNYVFDPNALCGIIFCNSTFKAKMLYAFVSEMSKHDPDLSYLCVQYTGDNEADPVTETEKYESEHRKQEEVLKRFRTHSCNLLIGTCVLEEGIELPKCNLVIRWDLPTTYRSYVQCKGKARTLRAYHVLMVAASSHDYCMKRDMEFLSQQSHRQICATPSNEEENADKPHQCFETNEVMLVLGTNGKMDKRDEPAHNTLMQLNNLRRETESFVNLLAKYMQIEQTLLKSCANQEPTNADLNEADLYTNFIKPYIPTNAHDPHIHNVSLANAIVLVNKYCSKLPSDTFTKLTPLWRCMTTERDGKTFYQYTVRLPINSPVKQDIYVS